MMVIPHHPPSALPTSNLLLAYLHFYLQIILNDDNDELVLEPPAEAFYESMAQVQVAFVEQVKVVGRLLFNDKLQVSLFPTLSTIAV
jgi:hypothetical protein